MYDYGWIMYMPDIARWNGIDQLAESYSSNSPYAYVMNNPVIFTDPDGRSVNFNDWLDRLWTASGYQGVTTFSDFDSNGNWGSRNFSSIEKGATTEIFTTSLQVAEEEILNTFPEQHTLIFIIITLTEHITEELSWEV